MVKPVLLFGLIVIAFTLVTSCDNFSADHVSSQVTSDDDRACILNEPRYLSPPMDYTLYSLEYHDSGDQELAYAIPRSVTIPEDVLLLIGYWRNRFADGRLAERHAQFGHVVKSSIMYHAIDPRTDMATLVHKESLEEFSEKNPGDRALGCGLRINLPSYGKTYLVDFCDVWDYCNPPRTAFLNNMIVSTGDGQERYISLPME